MTYESLKRTNANEQQFGAVNYIFIGGCGRSGTTFLADQLGRALGWTVIPESQFKEELLLADFENPEARERSIRELMSSWRLGIWGICENLSQKTMKCGNSVRDVMNLLSKEYSARFNRNCIHWIDHTPSNVNCFHLLRREFPDSLFIHLVRDPRAVWASVKDLNWGPNSVCEFTEWWAHAIANGLAAELQNHSNVIRLYYEDIVVDTTRALDVVIKKIDPGNLVTCQLGKNGDGFVVPEYTKPQHKLVGLPPQLHCIDKWRDRLTKREIEIIEIDLAPLMNYFGYEAFAVPPGRRPRWFERFFYDHLSIWPKVIMRKIRRRIIVARQNPNKKNVTVQGGSLNP